MKAEAGEGDGTDLSPSQSRNLETGRCQQLPHSQGRSDAGEPEMKMFGIDAADSGGISGNWEQNFPFAYVY